MNFGRFKKSSLTEMCKQVVSAPVIFTLTDGTECLAFYNHIDPLEATKLYILFPDNSIPKYIEGNDIYNLRASIKHYVSYEDALALYQKVSKVHKQETINFFTSLINRIGKEQLAGTQPKAPEAVNNDIYNKKHACGLIKHNGEIKYCIMKDLANKHVSELIVDAVIDYDVTLDDVLWAASISSKEFTALKIKLRNISNA